MFGEWQMVTTGSALLKDSSPPRMTSCKWIIKGKHRQGWLLPQKRTLRVFSSVVLHGGGDKAHAQPQQMS